MPTIRVKITDSNQPAPWYASAFDDGRGPEATIKKLNKNSRLVGHIGKVTYELATEADYQAYFKTLRGSLIQDLAKDVHAAENLEAEVQEARVQALIDALVKAGHLTEAQAGEAYYEPDSREFNVVDLFAGDIVCRVDLSTGDVGAIKLDA